MQPKQLLYQQKRFGATINTKKPKAPHFEKALLIEFLTPYHPKPEKYLPLSERCENLNKLQKKIARKTINPYEQMIAREAQQRFDNSKMIAILHMNSINEVKIFDLIVKLKKENMCLKRYGRKVLSCFINDPPYAALNPLLVSSTAFIFSEEDSKVAILRKILKKYPEYIILGGILYGHLLSHNDFLKYGMTNLTTERAGLVNSLQKAGGVKLNEQLTHHQSTLVSRLKQIGTNNASETTPEKQE